MGASKNWRFYQQNILIKKVSYSKHATFNIVVYQDDSSDELSEVMDDLLLPASYTDDNWFQDEEEDDSYEDSEDDADENEDNNDLEVEDDSSDNQEVSLVNGKLKINGDERMESD